MQMPPPSMAASGGPNPIDDGVNPVLAALVTQATTTSTASSASSTSLKYQRFAKRIERQRQASIGGDGATDSHSTTVAGKHDTSQGRDIMLPGQMIHASTSSLGMDATHASVAAPAVNVVASSVDAPPQIEDSAGAAHGSNDDTLPTTRAELSGASRVLLDTGAGANGGGPSSGRGSSAGKDNGGTASGPRILGSSVDTPMSDIPGFQKGKDTKLIRPPPTGPRGPNNPPRYLLVPPLAEDYSKKCLVLDLDETLIHSSFKPVSNPDFIVPVEIDNQIHNVYVLKRPYVDEFLRRMGLHFEIVLFTASLSKYADPVIDNLDKNRVIRHRLFREACLNHRGNFVKDLSQLGRDLKNIIIVDNSPVCYMFHPYNAVPCTSWFNDPHDAELLDLIPFLEDLRMVDNVMTVLDSTAADDEEEDARGRRRH